MAYQWKLPEAVVYIDKKDSRCRLIFFGGLTYMENKKAILGERKSLLILCLYDSLLKGEKVNKIEYCKEHDMATRTFCRYISDIRDVISYTHPELELSYDRRNDFHYFSRKDQFGK